MCIRQMRDFLTGIFLYEKNNFQSLKIARRNSEYQLLSASSRPMNVAINRAVTFHLEKSV